MMALQPVFSTRQSFLSHEAVNVVGPFFIARVYLLLTSRSFRKLQSPFATVRHSSRALQLNITSQLVESILWTIWNSLSAFRYLKMGLCLNYQLTKSVQIPVGCRLPWFILISFLCIFSYRSSRTHNPGVLSSLPSAGNVLQYKR